MTRLSFRLLQFVFILSATNQAFCQELNLNNRNPVIKDSGSENVIPYCQLWAFSDDTINIYISDKDGLFSFDSGGRKSYSSVWICRSGYETKIISSQKEMAEDDFFLAATSSGKKITVSGNSSTKVSSIVSLLPQYTGLVKLPGVKDDFIIEYISVFTGRKYEEGQQLENQLPFKLLLLKPDGKGNPGAALFNKTIIVFPNAIEASWIRFDISPFRIRIPYEGVFAGLECMAPGYYDDYKNNNPSSQRSVFLGSGRPGLFSNNNFECWMHMPWFEEWKILDRKNYHFMINAGISKAE